MLWISLLGNAWIYLCELFIILLLMCVVEDLSFGL